MFPNVRDIEYFEVSLGRALTALDLLDFPVATIHFESASYAVEVIQRDSIRVADILRNRLNEALKESALLKVRV